MKKLGTALSFALEVGAPQPLVAAIATTQHRGRLKRLFRHFAARFLEAYAEAAELPGSRQAAKRRLRCKATLDLVRARISVLGKARPEDAQMLDWAREADMPRLVHLRRVA